MQDERYKIEENRIRLYGQYLSFAHGGISFEKDIEYAKTLPNRRECFNLIYLTTKKL